MVRSTLEVLFKFWSEDKKKNFRLFQQEVVLVLRECARCYPKQNEKGRKRGISKVMLYHLSASVSEATGDGKKRACETYNNHEHDPSRPLKKKRSTITGPKLVSNCSTTDYNEIHPVMKCGKTSDDLCRKI